MQLATIQKGQLVLNQSTLEKLFQLPKKGFGVLSLFGFTKSAKSSTANLFGMCFYFSSFFITFFISIFK